MAASVSDASYGVYEFTIEINAPAAVTWKHLLLGTNNWWTDSFRMLGETSTIELDISPGGKGLIESTADGELLHWYAVQAHFAAQRKLYLCGYLAADYGGPRTTLVRIHCEEVDTDRCRFHFQDSQVGKLTSNELHTMEAEWRDLFTKGFKTFVEAL